MDDVNSDGYTDAVGIGYFGAKTFFLGTADGLDNIRHHAKGKEKRYLKKGMRDSFKERYQD